MTLVLQSQEIKKIVYLNSDLIPVIENAFKSLSNGEAVMPPILRLDIKKYHGESDVKGAYIEGLD
ncbi:ornithine cyclodeaminase family protein, partial [Alphaproteobacteria bacterium]|nr:ornithine cyclodeaminase family protein [Alphaproteobacteria bacterium]